MISPTLGAAAAEGWVYLAEGGAHLVLERRDVAGDDPHLAGRVLRLRKTKNGRNTVDKSPDGSTPEHDAHGDIKNKTERITDNALWRGHPHFTDQKRTEQELDEQDLSWSFVHYIMRPLLGEKFVDAGQYVDVDYEFLNAVALKVAPERPKVRVNVSSIDLSATKALLLIDAIRVDGNESQSQSKNFSTFSIELKPKCGFLLPGDNTDTNISRFQMHQRLMLANGETHETSQYDPLYLFSGNDAKIKKALAALAKFPRNNFRVRRRCETGNSTLVFGEGVNELLEVGSDETGDAHFDTTLVTLLRVVKQALKKSDVLSRILAAQKRDYLGVEKVSAMVQSKQSVHDTLNDPALSSILRDFIVSTVAKDCSVLIAARREMGKGEIESKADDRTFSVSFPRTPDGPEIKYKCRVSVVDVDLKSVKQLAKWLALDREIREEWGKSLEGGNSVL